MPYIQWTKFLLNDGPDLIRRHLRAGKMWEAFTLTLSKMLLENVENPVVLDIGAHLGAWSVPMEKYIAERSGKLYAFEPQRAVFYPRCGNFY